MLRRVARATNVQTKILKREWQDRTHLEKSLISNVYRGENEKS